MERRKFLKSTCQLCLLGAAGYLLPTLSSCATSKSSVYKTALNGNNITIPLSLFDQTNIQIVRPTGWFYDIAVHKKEDGTFAALLMKCTHMDNQLVLTGSGFSCSLHGSTFSKEGVVQKGPAEHPLQHYTTTIQANQLIITI